MCLEPVTPENDQAIKIRVKSHETGSNKMGWSQNNRKRRYGAPTSPKTYKNDDRDSINDYHWSPQKKIENQLRYFVFNRYLPLITVVTLSDIAG